MKNPGFLLILLVMLAVPLHVRAQQAGFALSPSPSATASPAITPSLSLTASPTPTSTFTATATPSATPTGTTSPTATVTSSATLTSTAVPTETATSIPATGVPTFTATLTETPILPSATPTPLPTRELDPVLTGLFSRIAFDSGHNPANAGAALLDLSGQVIANVPLNPDGTFTISALPGNYILQIRVPGCLVAQKPVTLAAGQPVEVAAILLPSGDINGDNSIDALDLISLGAAYELASPQLPAADLNGDGHIDLFDLTLLARNWRRSGPLTW